MNSKKLNENWQLVYNRIKNFDGVDASQVDAIFSRVHPQAMSEDFLMLSADNAFIKSWVDRNYLSYIQQALNDLYAVPFNVVIEVDETAAQDNSQGSSAASSQSTTKTSSADDLSRTNNISNTAAVEEVEKETAVEDAQLQNVSENLRNTVSLDYETQKEIEKKGGAKGGAEKNFPTLAFSFENFVIGDSNRMAYSMAVSVAEMPGKTPLNPLFIYGKSGLGKTHLMRAIQNYICETQPQLKTVYVDSEELLSDYMDAGAAYDKEKSSYKNFKNHYEEADVLLIDDIQYLQGKTQTLDIVFQIFNKLISQGRQIVLSADRAPKNIDIDERYQSRFNQGGTIDIQPPEIETKLAIVKAFIKEYCQNEGVPELDISEEIQMYIAENSSSNIRELKSAVIKVIYQIQYFNNPNLTIEDVRILLENHFSGGNSKNLTIDDIQKVVENFFKVKHSDLVGLKRSRTISYPRHLAIYLCRQLLDMPFNDIGKKFNRDHSTAMHSVTTVEEMMRQNREVQEEVETLKQQIRDL